MSEENPEIEKIRAVELQRVTALVNGDLETARRLHAEEYELITPFGVRLSKDQYLGAIDALAIRYLFWSIDSEIKVRLHQDVALLRYQATIEPALEGRRMRRAPYWHTDIYEKGPDGWQAIWSQATEIA